MGAGTVVSCSMPQPAAVGPGPKRIIKYRNHEHDVGLERSRRLIRKSLHPILDNRLKTEKFILKNQTMKKELRKVPIVKSGVEKTNDRETPFVVLSDNTILYGRFPTDLERVAYRRWQGDIQTAISEDTIRVAMDVILRYQYPHAMPHLTMPYSRSQRRRGFHNQHIETIKDLPGLSDARKDEIADLFTVKKGENYLDAGAYIGFGAVRMSRETGPGGRIIAVESDEDACFLLEVNVEANNISNVTVMPAAVSDHDGFETFYKTERQANSLISEVVDSDKSCKVKTITIDSILRKTSLSSINRISLTINGAEVEAVEGMRSAVENSGLLRVSAAGWYKRNGQRISDLIAPKLRSYGLQVSVGRDGGVLAWKQTMAR